MKFRNFYFSEKKSSYRHSKCALPPGLRRHDRLLPQNQVPEGNRD